MSATEALGHERTPQTELGKKIGVIIQQVQKYENGVNRVGSGNLFKAALGIRVSILFECFEHAEENRSTVLRLRYLRSHMHFGHCTPSPKSDTVKTEGRLRNWLKLWRRS